MPENNVFSNAFEPKAGVPAEMTKGAAVAVPHGRGQHLAMWICPTDRVGERGAVLMYFDAVRRWVRTAIAVLVALCAFVVAAGPAQADDQGLVAQWHLDAVTGGATLDSSGNGLTGLETAGALVPGGRFASALQTTNLNDGFTVLDSPLLEPAQVTVMAWVKKGAASVGAAYPSFRTIVSKGSDSCGVNESYALDTGPDGGIRFLAFQGGTSYASVASAVAPASIWNSQWHAVAGTFDGTTARLYVDGVQVGSAPAALAGGAIHYGLQENRLAVGRFPQGAPCDPAGFQFVGTIDEVRVYSRALSAAEVSYLQDAAATSPPNLPIPGGGGGGTSTPLHVQINPPSGIVKAGSPVTLSATTTGGAKIGRYVWHFGAAGGNSSCNGEAPVVQETFDKAYSGPVTVTAFDVAGGASTAVANISVQASQNPNRAQILKAIGSKYASKIIPASQVVSFPYTICVPPPIGPKPGDVTPGGGSPAGCVSQVVAGLVSAIGCLTRTSDSALPDAERRILYPFADFDISQFLHRKVTTKVLAAAASANPRPPQGPLNKKPIVLTQDDTDKLIGANFVSRTGVRINGVDYQPVGGASILVTVGGMLSHTSSYVVSSNAIVSINGVPLRSGQLQLLVDVSQNQVHVTDLDLHRDVPFASGLTMAAGRTSLDLVNGGSLLATHIGLPDIFGGVTADATIRLTNPNGAELSNLAFHLGQFQLAGVGVDHADLTYSDSPLQLTGDAQVVLWPGGPTIAARLVLGGGTSGHTLQFQSLSGSYSGIPIPLQPEFGTYLIGLRLNTFALYPPVTEFGVGATVAVGGVDLCAPYRIDGDATLHFYPSPVAFDFTGAASLFCQTVAHEFLHIDDTGYVHFGGDVTFDLGIASIGGRLDAQWLFPHFQAEGVERVCIAGYLCANANAIVSDQGAAGCIGININLVLKTIHIRVGAGFDWPPPATLVNPVATAAAILSSASVFTGCDFGHWRTVTGARDASAGQAAGGITVRSGMPAFSVAVVGHGAAPDVELRGPRGESYTLPASGPRKPDGAIGFRSPVDKTAYFAVARPSGGRWTIVPRPGSSAITQIRSADGLPDPSIKLIRLSSTRGHFAFRYRIAPIAGQKVTFVEHAPGGDRRLAVATRNTGVLRFTPSDARGNKRSIVALVQQDGQPRANIVLRRFTAEPARPGKPPKLVARRRGGNLTVRWGAAANAQRYQATIKVTDGRSLFFFTTASKRTFSIRNVAAGDKATVRVYAVLGRSIRGAVAILHVAAVKKLGTPGKKKHR